jgi:hypothetical protein
VRQTRLQKRIGVSAAIVLGAIAFAGAARAQVIYQGKLVYGLPGPEALYDPDQGQPQALLPQPCDVVFPGLGFPAGGPVFGLPGEALRSVRCRPAGNWPIVSVQSGPSP